MNQAPPRFAKLENGRPQNVSKHHAHKVEVLPECHDELVGQIGAMPVEPLKARKQRCGREHDGSGAANVPAGIHLRRDLLVG